MTRVMTEAVRLTESYLISNARVLERRRFDYLFGSPATAGTDRAADAVVTALAAYRNPDGGYGNALEPDCRAPGSQPVTTAAALAVLDEVGRLNGGSAIGVGDYLCSISAPDGGVPFVHPAAREHPRAPWWQIPDDYAGSLLPTATLAGLLHKNRVDHPWLGPATEFCWRRIEALTDTHPYEALACISFLDHVPDRARAARQAARIGRLVRDQGSVALGGPSSRSDDVEPADVHYPHDFAASPESLARQWFSDAEIQSSLDILAGQQGAAGSWPVRWPIWTPVTAYEWGGWVSIDALLVLRRYGRLG